jgi:hypothetical protein
VPECKPNYVIVTVTITGINERDPLAPVHVVKSYEKCCEICANIPLNVPISFKGDMYNFNFNTVDPTLPPLASAEITVDWYASCCW